MYMSFRLQYMDATGKHWVDLASPKSPIYVYVGPGSSVRQGGRSFQLVPRTGKPAATLRNSFCSARTRRRSSCRA